MSVGGVRSRRAVACAAITCLVASSTSTQALTINLLPNADLASNSAALSAFQRAASLWEARFTDPITVNITAGLSGTMPAGTIGSTGSVFLVGTFDEIRDQLVADSTFDPDDGITAHLPTHARFDALLPAGRTLSGYSLATKANLKAMGFTGLDDAFGTSDAEITFNSTFTFDYDNRDGTNFGETDFETVAAHEIGHVLGFVSVVDEINAGVTNVAPMPLDFYRFRDGLAGSDPTSAADFETALRDLTPGGTSIFDDTWNEFALSTGHEMPEFPHNDGRQASHWKDDELTGFPGPLIGLMDPTLAPGNFFGFPFVESLSYADLRALDLIGWDFVVPEPTAVMAIGLVAPLARRRRS